MNIRTEALTIKKLSVLTFAVLLGIATMAPLAHNQYITGTLVNASLFIAVATLGTRDALLIGLIPSAIALATGLLPPVLAPMIPFIIVSNSILAMIFGALKNKNYWLGALTASLAKFGFLFATSAVVANLIINEQIAVKAAEMMNWPQLVTAVSGSILASGCLYLTKNRFQISP